MHTLVQAFLASDWVGKVIVSVLFLASGFTWAVAVTKWRELNRMVSKNRALRRFYKKQAHPAALYLDSQEGKNLTSETPLAPIYRAVMTDLLANLRKAGMPDERIRSWREGDFGPALPSTILATIKATAEGELSKQILHCEARMSGLATCVSAAPSLGLFGTVWGIMGAFMSMVDGGSTILITNVAPGIAGALLTTIAGLFVAIPAAVMYNTLSDRIRSETVEMESFTDMLLADIARDHERTDGATAGTAAPVAQVAPIVLQTAPYAYAAPAPAAQPVYAPSAPASAAAPSPAPAAPASPAAQAAPPSAFDRFGL